MRAVLAGCLFLLMTMACSREREAAQARSSPAHSRASLVLEQKSAKPGSQVRVGIEIATEKGWHIYWKNPGDSGEPPRIKWQLLEGVTVGPLEWPTPERMSNAAGTDYGYEGTPVLLTSLTVPSTMKAGTNIALDGDLHWLVCHDVCIPQKAQLKANLKVAGAEEADAGAQTTIRTAETRIPKPVPHSMRVRVSNARETFELSFVGDGSKQVVFFPEEPELIDNSALQERKDTDGAIRLELKKSDHLQGVPARLRGVLVNGEQAYGVDVPVSSTNKSQKEKRK